MCGWKIFLNYATRGTEAYVYVEYERTLQQEERKKRIISFVYTITSSQHTQTHV